jgi:Cupin domain
MEVHGAQHRGFAMKRKWKLLLGVAALTVASSSGAFAQNAPPSYQADPSIYKVIFEDANSRVVLGTWAPGAGDKPHSHTAGSIAYALTDCTLELTSAEGKTMTLHPKAGEANAVPATASHTSRNAGPAECRVVLYERK